jgi:hypothetical protein
MPDRHLIFFIAEILRENLFFLPSLRLNKGAAHSANAAKCRMPAAKAQRREHEVQRKRGAILLRRIIRLNSKTGIGII